MKFIIPSLFWATEGNPINVLEKYCKGNVEHKVAEDTVVPAKYKKGRLISEEVVHKGNPYYGVDISGDELIAISAEYDVMISNGMVWFDLKGKRFHSR